MRRVALRAAFWRLVSGRRFGGGRFCKGGLHGKTYSRVWFWAGGVTVRQSRAGPAKTLKFPDKGFFWQLTSTKNKPSDAQKRPFSSLFKHRAANITTGKPWALYAQIRSPAKIIGDDTHTTQNKNHRRQNGKASQAHNSPAARSAAVIPCHQAQKGGRRSRPPCGV